jgi:23S rRNA (pseudouridine1915-N3)-methyltransferase
VRYRIICVGKRTRDPLLDAAADYEERLGHYAKVELVRLRESSPATEAKDIERLLTPDTYLVALDEHGREHSTTELAQRLQSFANTGKSKVTYVIGGANGLAPEIVKRAKETWSLSRLTLPHRLALVVLVEQLYRAHTFLRGEPYHRGEPS